MNEEKQQLEKIQINTGSGYDVPLRCYRAADPETATATILLLPALGMAARFYRPLAEALSSRGINTVLFEQRGHGDSSLRAGRKVDYGFREHLEQDIPAALDWIERELGTDDITLMGHSLGGHLTACTVALQPQRFSRVILAASGTPWLPTFSGAIRWQIRLLRLIIPPLNLLCGHFPGNVLGFGGREATTLMRDWCALAKDNRYHARGMAFDFEAGMARFEGEVLRICYDADTYAPVKAADAVADKFTGARVDKRLLKSADLGFEADHFKWVRRPSGTVEAITDWLGRHDEAEAENRIESNRTGTA